VELCLFSLYTPSQSVFRHKGDFTFCYAIEVLPEALSADEVNVKLCLLLELNRN